MDYNQIAILFLQGTLIAFVILLLFRLRKQLGIGVLFACLGLFQFMQVFLSNTTQVSITNNFLFSPGSSIFITVTLFALLVVYIKEDAIQTKKIIYALFIVNLLITVLLYVFGLNLKDPNTDNSLYITTNLFTNAPWHVLIGNITLFLDSLLIIIIFEYISKRIRFLFLQICITMLIVVSFDTIFFSVISFWSLEDLNSIIISGLVAKSVFAVFYSVLFYFYLRYFDLSNSFEKIFNLRDVFQPLTYKQKFESVTEDIKKTEEKYNIELVLANKEKEKRIEELELSEQKLQYSLELLEKKDHSLKVSSKVAKIGYWEYDIATDVFIWSDYIYEMYGLDLNDKIPSRNEIIKFYDKDSQNKLAKATEDLTEKGIPYDIELKLINKRNEEVWVRNVVQLIHNQQNEIIGRRGVIHNITDSKKAQLEIELSQQKIKTSLELLKDKEIALHKISSIAKIGYWEYSIDNVNAIWSDYHYEIFGLNPKDGVPPKEKLFSYFDKESQEKIEKANLKLHTEGVAFDIKLRLINQKNKELWVRNVVQPVFDKHNKIIGRRGLLQDITENIKAKQEIITSLELLEKRDFSLLQASEMAKIGYWEYELLTDTYIWSDYVYKLCGLDSKDKILLQKEIVKMCDEESLKKLELASLNLYANGTPYDVELKLINFKNVEIWIRSVGQPIYDQENEIIGRKGVIQDITENKNAQLELELSKEKIQESLELLEKRKYSMDEAGKLAKIGYWDVNTENNISIWSDYVHYAIGSNPKAGIPDQSIVQKYLSKESFELFTKSTEEITLKGTPYDIEINFKNLKNQKVWIRVIAQPVYNQQNKIIGRRGLLQNITASKIAEEKIQESLNLLENSNYSMDEASKIAKIGYFEHNMVTDTFKWSDYLFNIHGFDPKQPVPPKKEFIKYLDQESITALNNAVLNLTTKGVSYDIELKVFNKIKNKDIWVRSVAQPIYNDKNEIIGRRGVTQDITIAKNAQQELELSKQKIQESLELLERRKYSMDEASKIAKIGYWDHDIETEYVSWSDYVHTIFGSNPEEGIPEQNSLFEKFSKRSQEEFTKVSQDLLLKGQPYDVELKYNNPKKGVVWIRSVAQPIYNQQNKIIGKRGVLQDITDEKNTELKLRENEEKFFNIFKNSPNLIILTRLKDYKIVDTNDAAFKVTGYTPEEIINNSNFPKAVWKSLEDREKYFERLIKNGKIKNHETEFVIKSGEIRFWKTSSQIIKISNEKYSLSTIEDITDIKEAQIEIQKQTEFINAMTENQPNAIIACNSEGELVFFNKKAIEWHGVNILKISSDKWVESYGLFKEDGETLLKTEEIPLMQAFKGQKIRNREVVIKAKNKNLRNVICNGTSFSDADGNILGAVIVMNDVTKQKLTENNLKTSESETRKALKEIERSEFLLNESGRLAKVGAWEMKLPSQEILWSKEVFAIHGLPVGEVPPFEDCVGYYVDGSAEILAKAVEKSIAEKKKFDLVLKFNNEKKQKLWVHSIGYPLTNEEGEVTSLIGVFQDITEQKTRQIKLDDQNEKLSYLNNALNDAQEISHLGSWEYNVATDKVTWSKELLNIFERSPELGAPNYAEHELLYPEESFIRVNNAVANCIENEIPYNIELEIYTSKGTLKHIVSRGKPIKDKNNKVIGCYGTAQDITEQKQIRLKIEETEKMYRILTDYSHDLISLQKPDGTFEYVSPAVKNLLGYEPSEFLGEKVFGLVHKDDIKRIRKTIENRMLKGVFNEPVSFRVVHKNGHYVWLEFLSSPVYKDNEISYFVTSSRDITQWVLAQKEIQEYQTSLQKLTTEITLIEERQKKDIASNIHDHLSQSLVISNMRIKVLKKNKELKAIDEDLNFIYEHISEALANSRKITSELSPPILYQLGIIEALFDLLENIEKKHKIKHQINDNTNGIELSEVKSILVYRSIQELFNNIIKYAEATLITIDINKNELGVDIFIRDNGVGFDTEKLNNLYHHNEKGSGFGLFTVKERIRNIQGEFKITSEINKGTTVTIFIPINE